ncbi:MAG: hypothetical protein AAGJ31_04795, partial [Verrucomicrobiota bacterium]
LATFSAKSLDKMLFKSLTGYLVAFTLALVLYLLVGIVSRRAQTSGAESSYRASVWVPLQWMSTGFLWSQWLIQDLANIFVYLPRSISASTLLWASLAMVALYAFLLQQKGGRIQEIVRAKTGTHDIRAATCIDFLFASILLVFKEMSAIPMSTTWVFLGLLGGREVAIRWLLHRSGEITESPWRDILLDLGKAAVGILVSVAIALLGTQLK